MAKIIRKYVINWYANKDAKYGDPIIRSSNIQLINPTGKTEFDSKAALGIFMKNYGGLHKNTVVSIKEFDENGQIGEDIVPSEDNSIIPSGVRKGGPRER